MSREIKFIEEILVEGVLAKIKPDLLGDPNVTEEVKKIQYQEILKKSGVIDSGIKILSTVAESTSGMNRFVTRRVATNMVHKIVNIYNSKSIS